MERLQRGCRISGRLIKVWRNSVDNLLRQGADPLRVNQRSFQHESHTPCRMLNAPVSEHMMSPEARAEGPSSLAPRQASTTIACSRSCGVTPGIDDRTSFATSGAPRPRSDSKPTRAPRPPQPDRRLGKNRARLAQRRRRPGRSPPHKARGRAVPHHPNHRPSRQTPGERADDSAREQAQQARAAAGNSSSGRARST